jgi:AcrR family transcriptional regulator
MSPRPRKVSDSQLFAATHAVMNKVGPGELTLAAIAKEAGVTAAVLVQRFGSKRALLLALAHASPLAAIRAYADCMAGLAASPAALARSLAYLQIDMTDPDFRRHLVKQARATRAGLQRLVEAASVAGELDRTVKPAQLARTIETVLSGSLITWGFYREATAALWMRTDLEAVLTPWLIKRNNPGSDR